jgi:hypothetical protein
MPRLLSSANHTLRIHDNLSGSDIELYYRSPTTAEHTAYQNACVVRKGKKVLTRYPEARLKHGLAILTGFRAGDFAVPGQDGRARAIASNPGHADFDPDWRAQLEKYAGDLIQLLAAHVFDAPAEVDLDDAEPDGEAIEPD